MSLEKNNDAVKNPTIKNTDELYACTSCTIKKKGKWKKWLTTRGLRTVIRYILSVIPFYYTQYVSNCQVSANIRVTKSCWWITQKIQYSLKYDKIISRYLSIILQKPTSLRLLKNSTVISKLIHSIEKKMTIYFSLVNNYT